MACMVVHIRNHQLNTIHHFSVALCLLRSYGTRARIFRWFANHSQKIKDFSYSFSSHSFRISINFRLTFWTEMIIMALLRLCFVSVLYFGKWQWAEKKHSHTHTHTTTASILLLNVIQWLNSFVWNWEII